MELILHIGSPKTGTTTIQHWLRVNQGHLLADGIYVTRVCAQEFHSEFVVRTLQDPGIWPHPFSGEDPIPKKSQVASWRKRFDRALAKDILRAEKLGAKKYVVSSENFHSIPQPAGSLRSFDGHSNLAQYVGLHFDSIRVLAFTRKEMDLAKSYFRTLLFFGLRSSLGEWLETINWDGSIFNNSNFLEKWKEEFGHDHIKDIPYKSDISRRREKSPDVLKAFRQEIGHPHEQCSCSEFESRRNSAIPDRLVPLIIAVNLAQPVSQSMFQDYFSLRRFFVQRIVSTDSENSPHSRISDGEVPSLPHEISIIGRLVRSKLAQKSYWILYRYLPYNISLSVQRLSSRVHLI